MQLYDLNKKGTIVVGHMRSGSHYLNSLIRNRLISQDIPHDTNGEYFSDFMDLRYGADRYTFFNVIDKIKEQDTGTNYSTGTIVYPGCLDMISQSKYNFQYFMDNYHIVKNVRRDIMAQFMSMLIFNNINKHNGITSISDIAIKIPHVASTAHMLDYAYRLLELDRFTGHETVYYEDLPHEPVLGYTKNQYGITPREFFTNYDAIVDKLRMLNLSYEW